MSTPPQTDEPPPGLRAMRQDPPSVLVGDVDLDDRVAALLERDIVEIAVRGDEDFRVPDEALGIGDICDLCGASKGSPPARVGWR